MKELNLNNKTSVGNRIPEKLMFFFGNMCIYSTHVFALNNMAKEFQLDYLGLGIATGMTIFSFFGSYLFSLYNDKKKNPKKTVLICTISYAVVFGMFLINKYLKSFLTTDSRLENFLNSKIPKIVIFSVIFSLSQFFSSGLFPTMDRISIGMTRRLGEAKETFGKQRLWGIVGHGLTTVLIEYTMEYCKKDPKGKQNPFNYLKSRFTGEGFPEFKSNDLSEKVTSFFNIVAHLLTLVLDSTVILPLFSWGFSKSLDEPKEYVPLAYLVSSGIILCFIVMIYIPDDVLIEKTSDSNKKDFKEDKEKHIKEELKKVFSNPSVYLFFFVTLCAGYVRSILTYYLVFYTEAVKHLTTKFGVVNFEKPFTIFALAKSVSEILCFLFEKRLISLFKKPEMLIVIGNILGILRMFLYASVKPKNIMAMGFFIELLKGFNSGFLMTGSFRYINEIFPSEILSIGQGLFSGFFVGVSSLIGGLSTGIIMHFLTKKRTSFFNYVVLFSVDKKIEIDSEVHYEVFNTTFLITAIIACVGVAVFTLKSSGKLFKTKNSSTKPL